MGWKIYFWVMTILLLTAYAVIFTESPNILDFLDVLFSSIAIAGVFAYAYKRKLFSVKFWKIWLAVIISWDLTYNLLLTDYFGAVQPIVNEDMEVTFIEEIIGWLIIIPEYVALYLLAFKSDPLWKQ